MFDMTMPISGAAAANPNNLSQEELEELRQLESSFGFGSGLGGINEALKHFRLKSASVLYPIDLEDILNIYTLSNKIDPTKIYYLTRVAADVDFKKHHVSIPVSIYNECDIQEVTDVSMLQSGTVLLSENKSTATFSVADVPADVTHFVVVGYTINAHRKISFDNAVCYYRQDANNFIALKMRIAKGVFTFSDDAPVVGIEKIKTRTRSVSQVSYPVGNNYDYLRNNDLSHLSADRHRIPSSSKPHLPGLSPARPTLTKPGLPANTIRRPSKPVQQKAPQNAAKFNTDPFSNVK